jgi:hypothetical protein
VLQMDELNEAGLRLASCRDSGFDRNLASAGVGVSLRARHCVMGMSSVMSNIWTWHAEEVC